MHLSHSCNLAAVTSSLWRQGDTNFLSLSNYTFHSSTYHSNGLSTLELSSHVQYAPLCLHTCGQTSHTSFLCHGNNSIMLPSRFHMADLSTPLCSMACVQMPSAESRYYTTNIPRDRLSINDNTMSNTSLKAHLYREVTILDIPTTEYTSL
jgi:hypothetical protein